jgi:hypothetical protein
MIHNMPMAFGPNGIFTSHKGVVSVVVVSNPVG